MNYFRISPQYIMGDYGHLICRGGMFNGIYFYPVDLGLPIVWPTADLPLFTDDLRKYINNKSFRITAKAIKWNFNYKDEEMITKFILKHDVTEPDEFINYIIQKGTIISDCIMYIVDKSQAGIELDIYFKNEYGFTISQNLADAIEALGHKEKYNFHK
jgi:hypothetical protein